jgi:hypothetical protein
VAVICSRGQKRDFLAILGVALYYSAVEGVFIWAIVGEVQGDLALSYFIKVCEFLGKSK